MIVIETLKSKISDFLNSNTCFCSWLYSLFYKNSPLQDFARKREKITQRRRWLDEWSERCQNAQCAHSFHSGDVCQHISLIIFNPIRPGLFLSLEFLVGGLSGPPWYLSQGNLLGLERKAPGFFFKPVNIWDGRMCYTSFWKLGAIVFNSKNFFWNFLILT